MSVIWGILSVLQVLGPSVGAADTVTYDFGGSAPFIVDRSGHMNHGLALRARRVVDEGRSCLELSKEGAVVLPEAALLLGEQARTGCIELSVKPNFDPLTLAAGVYDGWVVLIYLQKTSGNGLPDGYNEVGLALHGPKLIAKVAGGTDTAPFAVIDTPLRQGQWTRLRVEWEPGRRALHVNGVLSAEHRGAYAAPVLDMFPACIGRHPASGQWGFDGLVSDVRVSRELSVE